MSNYLAIATATETLRQMLDAAVRSIIPGATATAVRPNLTGQGSITHKTCVNLFLYQLVPNAAWRNTDLPNRSGNGDVVRRPRAAFELHYLLSFYGKDSELEPQRMLGRTVQALHSHPMLTRQQVRDAVASANFLTGSNLAEEIEQVRVVPLSLSLEELSKIWSVFFQSAYALSVAYQASVVLIEGDEAPRQTLPVLQRTVRVLPYQRPVIEEVSPPVVEVGASLTIRGRALNADVVKVRLGRTDLAPASLGSELVTVNIPAGLAAGVNTVQVVQFIDFATGAPSEPHRFFESNVAPFILAPKLTLPPLPEPVFGTVNRGTTLTLEVSPPVGRLQDARLILGSRTIVLPARPPASPPATGRLVFPLPPDLPTGEFLLRLQVDGAQSGLSADPNGFTGPRIVIDGGNHCLRCTALVCTATPTGVDAQLTVKDENGAVVSGADVEITWTLPDGTSQADSQGTNNLGLAQFSVAGAAGSYRLSVDQIRPTRVGNVTFYFDQAQSMAGQTFMK